MKKWTIVLLFIILMAGLTACGDDKAENDQDQQATEEESPGKEQVDISEDEKMDPSAAILKINGEAVSGEAYNATYVQVKTLYGANIKDQSQLKELTRELLTQQELINQDADRLGIEVTEQELEAEFESYKENNDDQFQAVLDRFQLSEEAFKTQLKGDLIRNKYIEDQFDIDVSDEDIQSAYEQQYQDQEGENVPELEEVRDQLKQGLLKQKEQSKVQDRVKELKEEANIEVLVEE